MNLLKLLTAEAQSNIAIFNLIEKFFVLLENNNWIKEYIFWELELLKLLGYDLELKKIVEKEIVDNKTNYFVSSAKEKKNVPSFLVDDNIENIDLKILLKGLNLVSDYLEKSILRPNNINYPNSRLHFVSLLK